MLCRTLSFTYGLIDKPGGEREIVFGVDDDLLKEEVRNIPRADVATVCVEALTHEKAKIVLSILSARVRRNSNANT